MKKKEIALKIGEILNNVAEKIAFTDIITIEEEAKWVKNLIEKGEPLEGCLFIVVDEVISNILLKVIEDEKERNSSGT